MYVDVQKVYDYLKQYYCEFQIIVLGYLLGIGMVIYFIVYNDFQ